MREDDALRSLLIQTVGAKVADTRSQSKRGCSQSALAVEVGVSRAAISALEAGRRGVSLVTLCRIAAALDVPPSVFLPGKQELQGLFLASKSQVDETPLDGEILDRFVEEVDHG